jgi:VanZ family protein
LTPAARGQEPAAGAAPSAPAPFWSFQVWPALGSALGILVLGSLPMATPGAQRHSDKLLHALGFGVFAWLTVRAVRAHWPAAGRRGALLAGFAASAGLGALLELWQALLPYRSAELLDFVADALGALLAVAVTAWGWRARLQPS